MHIEQKGNGIKKEKGKRNDLNETRAPGVKSAKNDGTKGFPAHATITRLPDNTLQEITYNSHLTQDRYKTG